MTPDGSIIAFRGRAGDLVAVDTNGEHDVFVYEGDPDLVAVASSSSLSDASRISFIHSRVFPALIGPFEIGVYRSTDTAFDAGDGSPYFTRSGSGLAMTIAGLVYSLGAASPLPGAGAAEDDEDYSLLAVVDHLDTVSEDDVDPFNEDNVAAFTADYHLADMPWMVHGSGDVDSIVFSTPSPTTLSLDFNDRSRALDLAAVPTTRIRAHGGDDYIVGSPLGDFIHGGAGDDTIDAGDGDDIIYDGPGDDVVEGGAGDDTIFSTPGSDDLFSDTDGNDTISFAKDDQPISLDLDSSAVQRVDPPGNTVRLLGQWENFVGGPLDDTLYMVFAPVPRHVQGGPGSDMLHFDAKGRPVEFDGTRLRSPGVGDVTVDGFEEVKVFNAAPRYVDDGGAGYSDNGFGLIQTTQGYNSDVRFSASGSGHTATWTFDQVPPGEYMVSATWTFAGDRAKNSPFVIRDGGPGGPIVASVLVNQEQNPGEFDPTDDGQSILFRNLAIVSVTGHTVTVQLTDIGADQYVAADAIRIEPVRRSWVIDDGDPGFSATGFAPRALANNASGRGAFGDAWVGGTVGSSASYEFLGLEPGSYMVYATWPPNPANASSAPFHGETSESAFDIRVDQRVAPDDVVTGGVAWERVGRLEVGLDGRAMVDSFVDILTDFAVLADAIRLHRAGDLSVRLRGHDGAPPVAILNGSTIVLPDTVYSPSNADPEGLYQIDVRNSGGLYVTFDTWDNGNGSEFTIVPPPSPTVLPPGATDVWIIETNPLSEGGPFETTVGIRRLDEWDPFEFTLRQGLASDPSSPFFLGGGILHALEAPRFIDPMTQAAINRDTRFPDGAFEVEDNLGIRSVDVRLVGPGYDETLRFEPELLPIKRFFDVFKFPRPLPLGTFTLTGQVTDLAGNVGSSAPKSFDVVSDEPPRVEIVAPIHGDAFIEGEKILVEAFATDDVAIARVEFLADGAVVHVDDFGSRDFGAGAIYYGEAQFPYTARTTRIQARAIDVSGHVTETEPIEISFLNADLYPYFNPREPLDIDDDGRIVVGDLFHLLRRLAQGEGGLLAVPPPANRRPPPYLDPTFDGRLTVSDVTLILRRLRRLPGGEGESTRTAPESRAVSFAIPAIDMSRNAAIDSAHARSTVWNAADEDEDEEGERKGDGESAAWPAPRTARKVFFLD
ncbi:MAG: hypothetical protein FJ297_07970 [Planctomycetes bacterium]|nr:hypothetical protein [Planctomycetota bacterium]